ncbi:MAG: dTMP kinase [Rhodospirillaceae bacterium]|nr:dTMP kinase [Rhodospirillaceae bacterium]
MTDNTNLGYSGRFISLEGGEGAGKSTQVTKLTNFLQNKGKKVLVTREPGGSKGAEEIRNLLVNGEANRWDPVTEVLLLYAARRDHWLKSIQPALLKGFWVVCDRFSDSTIVYQGFGGGVDRDTIEDIHKVALADIRPDLTFFLDLPVELGMARSSRRDFANSSIDTRYEKMSISFHRRLRGGFKQLALEYPDRIIIVDGTRKITQVEKTIRMNILSRFEEEL